MYRQLLKVSGMCGTPFFSYWPKPLTKLLRALYGGAILVCQYGTPLLGNQNGPRFAMKTRCFRT